MNERLPELKIIGHSTGAVGEVTNAAKILQIARKHGIRASLHDLYHALDVSEAELNSVSDYHWKRLNRGGVVKSAEEINETGARANAMRIRAGIKSLVDPHAPPGQQVAYLITMPWRQIGVIASGITQEMPAISRYYPTKVEHSNAYAKALSAAHVVSTISPTGLLSAERIGIPAWKTILIQHSYPPEADALYKTSEEERREGRKRLIERVAAEMGKHVRMPRNAVLFASINRLVPEKNQVQLIRAFRKIAAAHPNAFLLIKDEGWRTEHEREEFERLVEEVKDEPWFLWDKTRTPFPEVLRTHHLAADVMVNVSGSEGAATNLIEAAALGKPILTLDATTHPHLFKDAALFAKSTAERRIGQVFSAGVDEEDLAKKLSLLAKDEGLREDLGRRARSAAVRHFSRETVGRKVEVAVQAARAFHSGTAEEREKYRRLLEQMREEDLRLFGLK
ncbi:MAG: glycosyltransferase [Candidatus Micrarchaeota archaeon]